MRSLKDVTSPFSILGSEFDLQHVAVCLSRFFLGSNKVLQIALGKTDADEQKEGLHKASEVCRYQPLLYEQLVLPKIQ